MSSDPRPQPQDQTDSQRAAMVAETDAIHADLGAQTATPHPSQDVAYEQAG